MERDAHANIKHGQRVSDAFHLSDYFIDNTADRYLADDVPNSDWDVPEQLSRLIKIITHSDVIRPTIDETAMYAAHGAGMRSACLSRQVGAALVDRAGSIIATGTNEVPRAGGGVYGESPGSLTVGGDDHRCAYRPLQAGTQPFCSNTVEQNRIVDDAIARVPELSAVNDKSRIVQLLRESRIGELLEFSRAVHAEMDALLSSARSGMSSLGSRLYVTTFPCHYCARHIVTAGLDQVQYIEPYPKSRALKLHSDSITIERARWKAPSEGGDHVLFAPFTGVAPRLYSRAFIKDRELKDANTGTLLIGQPSSGSPWYLSKKSYAQLEAELAKPDESTPLDDQRVGPEVR
jgi:deoxycytidylate deaminase